MVILHNSITGSSMRLANRFSYPSKHIRNFSDEDGKIIIIGRRFFQQENLWNLTKFINENRRGIVGVILYDDKAFGREFGSSAEFFRTNGVKVLAIWDKTVSEREIKEMEVTIDELVQ